MHIVQKSAPSALLAIGGAAQSVVLDLRKQTQKFVPETFSWWLEIGPDFGFVIRWLWLGHRSVFYIGKVTDLDSSIALLLLEATDWEREIDLSILSVEDFERRALETAQRKRRLSIDGNGQAIEAIRLPSPPPVSIDEKRDLEAIHTATQIQASTAGRLHDRSVQAALSAEKTVLFIETSTALDIEPTWALSRMRGPSSWEEFSDVYELQSALLQSPAGTYRRAGRGSRARRISQRRHHPHFPNEACASCRENDR
jgi:hypothetical protein